MTTHASITARQAAPADVRTALTLFRFEFEEALGTYQLPDMTTLGIVETSSSLVDRFEVSVGDPLFEKLVGNDGRYRTLGELFFELTTAVWQDGVKETAKRLRTAEWARRGWGRQPQKMAFALKALYERILAAAFMASKTTASIENLPGSTSIKVAQASHPCDPLNPSGASTYDNLHTSRPLNAAGIQFVRQLYRTQKGQNGTDYRNNELSHIVVGPDLEETLLSLIKDDLILVASDVNATPAANAPLVLRPNPTKKYKPIIPIINPYLTESGVWYPCAADETGELPWLTMTKVPPSNGQVPGMPGPGPVMSDGLEWTIDDETSETYKHGSKVGPKGTVAIGAQAEVGSCITMPWRFKRCEA